MAACLKIAYEQSTYTTTRAITPNGLSRGYGLGKQLRTHQGQSRAVSARSLKPFWAQMHLPYIYLATCAAANYQDQQLGQQQQPLWVFLRGLYSSDYRRYSSESAAAKFYVHPENLLQNSKFYTRKFHVELQAT